MSYSLGVSNCKQLSTLCNILPHKVNIDPGLPQDWTNPLSSAIIYLLNT